MKRKVLQEKWKSKFSEYTGNKKDKCRANYLHFDAKPKFSTACDKIFQPSYISKHAFWPFVFYKSKAEKIKLLEKYLSKHSLSLPLGLSNKDDLPSDIKGLISSDPDVVKALISREGNPHKYSTWKVRPICYASHIDSLIYSYYSELLYYDYEKLIVGNNLEDNVLAFRKSPSKNKVCNIDHSLKAFNDIRNYNKSIVLAFDVSSFFDILDHQILKDKWLQVVQQSTKVNKLPDDHFSVFKSITSYSYVDRDEVYDLFKISKSNPKKISRSLKREMYFKTLPNEIYPVIKTNPKNKKSFRTRICSQQAFRVLSRKKKLKIKKNFCKKGIPQGSPISGLLSNIYMIDFDIKIKGYVECLGGKYYRYCDDLLCIIPIKEHSKLIEASRELENFVYNLAIEFKLDVNKDKTEKYAFMPDEILNANYKNKDNKPARLHSSKLSCAKISDDDLFYSRLQYLGFKFDGNEITIRSSSMSRYHKKLRRGVKYHLRLKNKHDPDGSLKRFKIRKLYSHVGVNNFPRYVYRSANIMNSEAIRKQINKHQRVLNKQVEIISKRIDIKY
ncbi:reverse transcriptase domain-containing protein [Photobacterium damselae]|uniref:reverse transcriptase domain-containing protein n=1 Tax=Photobacterium damselae TaxID=38293 RepID=UPI0040695168